MKKIFPDLTIPGWLLDLSDLDKLQEKAEEIVETADAPIPELDTLHQQIQELRKAHKKEFKL